MWLVIEALDVLFFRESKPFSAGENFRARSAFPPSAEPFVGALRSRVLAAAGVGFDEYFRRAKQFREGAGDTLVARIGTPDSVESFHVSGPFVVRREAPEAWCLPMPRDALVLEAGQTRSLEWLQPVDVGYPLKASPVDTDVADDSPLRPLVLARELRDGTRIITPDQWWITAEGFQRYLLGQPVQGTDLVEPGQLWCGEHRTSIERSSNRTASQGMFYTAEFIRMKPQHAFLLGVEGLDAADLGGPSGMLALGGMRRAAEYGVVESGTLQNQIRTLTEDSRQPLTAAMEGRRQFKLCVATPACFLGGWLPDFLDFDGQRYAGQVGGCGFRLVAAAVGKPVYAAGWDYSRRRPKAMRRSVPAGSVYLFETDKPLDRSTADGLLSRFHAQSICRNWKEAPADGRLPPLTEFGKRGAGFTFLGIW